MPVTRYSNGSAYAATPQSSWYLDNLVLRNILPDPTDKAMVISTKHDMRPYNLSYELYGTKDYWWVFQVLNIGVIRDPIYDFKAGLQIRVPTKERLLSNIQATK
ncbi:hypothetical protein D3C87_628280 [compost metagenome]